MKKIKYQFLSNDTLCGAEVDWSEINEEIVKAEAYNGEYEIFDDGQPEPVTPTEDEDEEIWDALASALQEGVDSI